MENRTRKLFIRFLNNQCTVEEELKVNQLLEDPEMMALLHQLMQEHDDFAEQELTTFKDYQSLRIENWQEQINQRITASEQLNTNKLHRDSRYGTSWIRYAAIFIGFIILIGVSWLWFNKTEQEIYLSQQKDILPGVNKAQLTLADGSVLSLADAHSGTIALQGGVEIEKTKEGDILYHVADQQQRSSGINTVTTPNGGQYHITLPDGSKAWLNAASSLSYPISFDKNERRVKMTGEVYFEVAKVKYAGSKECVPFFVETDKQVVQVLGTHFNVNAYLNEGVTRTTLAEGSVRVQTRGGQSALLKPGQLAILDTYIQVQEADIEQQLAWKNGDFIFRGETLESILRQVSRWYNVEVEYPEHLGRLRFNGMVSRSQPLSTIIEMIQSTKKATVTLKERRFIVTD